MTSAIMNPTSKNEINAVKAANLLINKDLNGTEWILANRINTNNQQTNLRKNRRRNRK